MVTSDMSGWKISGVAGKDAGKEFDTEAKLGEVGGSASYNVVGLHHEVLLRGAATMAPGEALCTLWKKRWIYPGEVRERFALADNMVLYRFAASMPIQEAVRIGDYVGVGRGKPGALSKDVFTLPCPGHAP